MGLDVVELVMFLEGELEIDLHIDAVSDLWKDQEDILVGEFVDMVERELKIQNSPFLGSVFKTTRRGIAEITGIDESLITLNSWFRYDLDLQ